MKSTFIGVRVVFKLSRAGPCESLLWKSDMSSLHEQIGHSRTCPSHFSPRLLADRINQVYLARLSLLLYFPLSDVLLHAANPFSDKETLFDQVL